MLCFLQSKRLKQRTDKHMKEKYRSYYKKLKCFQDPVDNPENEGEQILVKSEFILNKILKKTDDFKTRPIVCQCRNRLRNTMIIITSM